MSNLVCLAGLSNSGKSTSLRTLDPESTFIISCTNKQLQIPGFRKKYPKVAIKDKKLIGNWYVQNNYTYHLVSDTNIQEYFVSNKKSTFFCSSLVISIPPTQF